MKDASFAPKIVMNNSFGFGGINTSIIFEGQQHLRFATTDLEIELPGLNLFVIVDQTVPNKLFSNKLRG